MWLNAVNTADMQSTIVRALVMCTYEASHQGIFAESLTSDNVQLLLERKEGNSTMNNHVSD